ncbi:MAG: hybrid sensor histidine kinase/response regulator [Desulfobacteria bacterium]
MTRVIDRVTAGLAVAIALLLPSLYFFISYRNCSIALKTEAEVLAPAFTELLTAYPDTWPFREVQLRKGLSGDHGDEAPEVRRIFDSRNTLVIERSEPLDAPVHSRSANLLGAEETVVGRIEISRSLRPVLIRTGGVALGGMLLGCIVFIVLRIFPMRMLRRTQESFSRELELARMMLHSIHEGVIVTNQAGEVERMNGVAEKLTGWPQEEASAKPLWEVFHIINSTTRKSLSNPVKRIMSMGEEITLANDTLLISRDERERVIGAHCAPVRDPVGRIIGAVVVFRDKTGKREVEEELIKTEKLESVGILAGGIAHDFNNILTAIMGNISLALLHRSEEGVAFAKIEEARKACLRARELTTQFLAFSRGGAPVRRVQSIGKILHESVGLALTGSRIRCDYSIPENICPVEVDRGQISQVIQNLVFNADHAMPKGGVIKVTARNVKVDDQDSLPLIPGEYVMLSVEDAGCGIPQKNLKKIFDPYFTTKSKGSGLGLSTSYFIIKNHMGHIDVESTVGVGSTVNIYLPAALNATSAQGEDEMQLAAGKGKILIMDDEQGILDVLQALLEHIGYTSRYARDGAEAVEMYVGAMEDRQPFDVIILDLTIPGGMGGKETMEKVLEVDPDVKAIVSSGYSNDPVMANYRSYGFKGIVPKPYRIEELSQVLHDVLAGEKVIH